MELVSIRIEESPQAAGRVRLVGEVAYDDRPGTEAYWFEVAEEHAAALSVSGTPWLALLLPFAALLGQKLRICAPVDPLLAENAPRILKTWETWYRKRFPRLRAVPIEVEVATAPPVPVARETGAFFSGGIDSFYTVLHNLEREDRDGFPRIDRLVWVVGFDIPIFPEEESLRARARLSAAARDLGLSFLDVRTNLRRTRFREVRWGPLGHGPGLAGVGLALERRFETLYIAGTYESGEIKPWGSHPETDSLFSTSSTRFVHDSAGVRRSYKTECISRSDVAMRALRVCFRSFAADNCCDCRKCLLAMLTLEVFGVLSGSPAFPRPLDLERVRRVYLRSPSYWRLYTDILVRAQKAGRKDIVKAIAACRRRYLYTKPAITVIDWLAERRGLWRVARRLRPAFLEGTIR